MERSSVCGFNWFNKIEREAVFATEGYNGQKKWIGVDFDGTLAKYYGFHNVKEPGTPIPEMVQRIRDWLTEGITVKIFTARVCSLQSKEDIDAQRTLIENWCTEHLGVKLEVTCEKDFNMVELWDNRAVGVIENKGTPLRRP